MNYFFALQAQSIGLYGDPFAAGYCLVDAEGHEYISETIYCPIEEAKGLDSDRVWVKENVVQNLEDLPNERKFFVKNPDELSEKIFALWLTLREQYKPLYCVGYCIYPIVTRLFRRCVLKNEEEREMKAPFPFFEVATALLLSGEDPLNPRMRNENELPRYHPLAEAKYASHLFIECIKNLKMKKIGKTLPSLDHHKVISKIWKEYFGLDSKSAGLYGDVYDFGYVRLVSTGSVEKGSMRTWSSLDIAKGSSYDKIARANCLTNFPQAADRTSFNALLDGVWELLETVYKIKNSAFIISWCPYPVESGLFEACIQQEQEERQLKGPYPIHDTATALFLANQDPIGDHKRLPSEDEHFNPITGSRQGARLFLEAWLACQESIENVNC